MLIKSSKTYEITQFTDISHKDRHFSNHNSFSTSCTIPKNEQTKLKGKN